MKKINLFVLDTNTLISAFILPHSTARRAFDKARKSGFLILSKETADEFKGVLIRPKFDKYLPLDLRLEIIDSFDSIARYIVPKHTVTDCRDEKDNKFLALAITAKANAIITGDNDLLVLNPYQGIPIVNATDFLKF